MSYSLISNGKRFDGLFVGSQDVSLFYKGDIVDNGSITNLDTILTNNLKPIEVKFHTFNSVTSYVADRLVYDAIIENNSFKEHRLFLRVFPVYDSSYTMGEMIKIDVSKVELISFHEIK